MFGSVSFFPLKEKTPASSNGMFTVIKMCKKLNFRNPFSI